jgi:hypothetical protein
MKTKKPMSREVREAMLFRAGQLTIFAYLARNLKWSDERLCEAYGGWASIWDGVAADEAPLVSTDDLLEELILDPRAASDEFIVRLQRLGLYRPRK